MEELEGAWGAADEEWEAEEESEEGVLFLPAALLPAGEETEAC